MTHEEDRQGGGGAGAHAIDRLQAWLDGEVPPAEAERLLAHCAGCAACGRALAEAERLLGALDRDAAALNEERAGQPSLWPAVRARTTASAHRRLGPWMALTASTAAAAGLLIGVLLGPREGAWGSVGQASAEFSDDWSDVGSLVADGSISTLDRIYLEEAEEGGEAP